MATMAMSRPSSGYVQRSGSSGLYEILDLILDKGLVIDVFLRVSLVGIELLTVDARIVIASVDTYLRFAEAVNRLDLTEQGGEGLPDLLGDAEEGGAQRKTKGALEGAKDTFSDLFSSDEDDDEDNDEDERGDADDEGERRPRRRRAPARRRSGDGARPRRRARSASEE